jgi:hypothetical protein
MNIHSLAITALFGAATAAKSTTRERKAFLADMKNANLALHPSERSLTKDQTTNPNIAGQIPNTKIDCQYNTHFPASLSIAISPEDGR